MKIALTFTTPSAHSTPALVIGCFEDAKDDLFLDCDSRLEGVLQRLVETREFSGKSKSTRLIHTLGKLPAERLLLVGLGKKADYNDERLRQAAGSAASALRGARISSFASALHLTSASPGAVEASCTGFLLGSYSFDAYKTKDVEERFSFEEMSLLFPDPAAMEGARAAVGRAEAIAQGVSLTRDLVSHPGNVVTPGYLARMATELADRRGIACRVFDSEELEKLGMNALLAVGKGSAEQPRLIVLEYLHGGEVRPILLVGKGVTFDSGGISIKPGAGMEGMKTDMAGAAAVFGVLDAVSALKLPVNVVAIVPTVENMPSGTAYKPGDVITSMSGLTIEITNTDAEGRMILCDALHYGVSTFDPEAVVDIATLTGACVVALGSEASGVLGSDPGLVAALKEAAERSGERVWELPLWDEYGEGMKSDIADLKNSGGREGGTIMAGWFLKQFVGATPWAHLDIAGTAWSDKARPYAPKGATGVGVRLLIEYLLGRVQKTK